MHLLKGSLFPFVVYLVIEQALDVDIHPVMSLAVGGAVQRYNRFFSSHDQNLAMHLGWRRQQDAEMRRKH